MCEISVIIPVYNVENYLEKCLDSVCNQSFRDIEIICINDGSKDSSGQILAEYSNDDDRIRIISQENRGLGAARNVGLVHAKGNFIYFMDSDDFIDSKTLEKLYNNLKSNDSDVVLFKFQNFDDNENVHHRGVEFKIDEIFGEIDYSNFTFGYEDAKRHVMNSAFSACLKMYKKEFLDLYDDFQFPENISFEDVPFHVKVMVRASKISFVNESLYYYRSNPDSILNSSANLSDIFKIIDMVEDFLKENGLYGNLENEFIFFKIAQILLYLKTSNSNDYFIEAKSQFSNLEIKNEAALNKNSLNGYQLVLKSDNYLDYLVNDNKLKLSKLKKKNKKLIKKNKNLKQKNEDILSSLSWKVTKPFRFLKNIKK